MEENVRKKTEKIKLIILDVDGVMTDGRILLDNKGNELKSFHVRDGHGIKIALKAGIDIAIITGRKSKVVKKRAKELGIREVHQGIHDKFSVYNKMLKKYNYTNEEVAFMGDDIVDLPLMKNVGLPAAPADGDELTIKNAFFVSDKKGGRGAVRDFIEFILKSSSRWVEFI